MGKTPLTQVGADSIRAELDKLKHEDRRNVSQSIAEARAHGDLKENAEYHAAKEQQGLMDARIRNLAAMISNAQIIDVTAMPNDGKVIFGATVDLEDVDDEKKVRYQLVGEDEADLKENKISNATNNPSPVVENLPKIMCPDCSPPKLKLFFCIFSFT